MTWRSQRLSISFPSVMIRKTHMRKEAPKLTIAMERKKKIHTCGEGKEFNVPNSETLKYKGYLKSAKYRPYPSLGSHHSIL